MTIEADQRLLDRFNAKVEKTDTCWIWTASTSHKGYGKFYVGTSDRGTTILAGAHRVSYEIHVGPVPDGLELDHLCRNPLCVNPAHLEPVTHAENNRRAALAGRPLCPQGHEYDLVEGSARRCRTCRNENQRRRHRMRRMAA